MLEIYIFFFFFFFFLRFCGLFGPLLIQIQISITDKCKVAARPGLETCSLVCCGILLIYAVLTRLRTFSVLHHRLMGCGALPHCKFSLLTTLLDNQHGSQSSLHEDNSLYRQSALARS